MYVAFCFEWDENKNRANRTKHGISFQTARAVFADPNSIMRPEREAQGERRWQTIGSLPGGVLIVLVAHTILDSDLGDMALQDILIRIISARKATPQERKFYEEGDWR